MPSPHPPQRPPAGARFGGSFARVPVVWVIAAINVVALLATEAMGGSTDTEVLLRAGAQARPLLEDGQLWRMLTATFLHFGALHLLANLWGLVLFGPLLERLLGHVDLAALYLASGLAGSAAAALANPPNAVSAGASGAVFGLLGAIAIIGFRLRKTPIGQAFLRQSLVLVGLNVFVGLSDPSIGLEAHLGGLAAGAIVMFTRTTGGPLLLDAADPQLATVRRRRRSDALAAAIIVAAGSVAAVAVLVR